MIERSKKYEIKLSPSPLPPPLTLSLLHSFSSPQLAVAGGVLGLMVGIGAPIFYTSRDEVNIQKERREDAESKGPCVCV